MSICRPILPAAAAAWLMLLGGCNLWITDADLCDTRIDRVRWYPDLDLDGFGDPASEPSCVPRPGWVDNNDDCGDNDNTLTGAAEMGEIPGVTLWYLDKDNDGYGVSEDSVLSCNPPAPYTAPAPDDCDDSDARYSAVCPWVDVTVGEDWSCGLRSDGSMVCWGDSTSAGAGHLEASKITAISGGYWALCTLYTDGTGDCSRQDWSLEPAGATQIDASHTAACVWDELGAYSCTAAPDESDWLDEDPPPGPVQAITLGEDFGCAVMQDTTMHCWGSQTGLDITPPAGTGWTAVQAGRFVACAAHQDGGVECWGGDPLEANFADVPTTGVFTSLHGSWDQTCGLKASGELKCWGGAPEDGVPPTFTESVVAVDSSRDHSCAVSIDGGMECWGVNDHGQTTVPDFDLHDLDLAANRSCALGVTGAISCWGDIAPPTHRHHQVAAGNVNAASISSVDQLLFWGRDDRVVPHEDTLRSFRAVAVYSSETGVDEALCVVDEAGLLQCWTEDLNAAAYEDLPRDPGYIDVAPGSLHGCALDAVGAVDCWSWELVTQRIDGAPTSAGWVQIAAAGFHTCAVHTDGSLACWGEERDGNLTWVPSGQDFVAVSTHDQASCALHSDGRVSCWGADDSLVVAQSPGGADFTAVSVAHDLACGLHADGTVSCWGEDSAFDSLAIAEIEGAQALSVGFVGLCVADHNGELSCITPGGSGELEGSPEVAPPGGAEEVAVGAKHLCAWRMGTVQCWGDDSEGQSTPPVLSDVAALAAGASHTCGLTSGGQLHCWGSDHEGQASPPSGDFIQVSAGLSHSCAIDTSGKVECWGSLTAATLTSATDLASGRNHACALAGGEVTCWGDNTHGQTLAPTGQFSAIAAGDYHSCALDESGLATCWGADTYRQTSGTPPYTFVELAAGGEHTCGLKLDGFATCWGRDLEGQTTTPLPTDGL